MMVQTQTPRLRQIRKTNLELIFSDHNAYCLPPCQNKCPSHIDIPGFLKANTEGNCASRRASSSAPSRSRACSAASARPRARSTAAATRSRRRSPSATATATPATRCSRRGRRASRRRCRSRSSRRPASGSRSSAPVRRACRPPTTCSIAGHDVTVFERDPAPGGMLRYGIPQYRLPKVEVLEAEYQSVARPRRHDGQQRRAGPRLHARRPPEPGLRRGRASPSAATTSTSWASRARTPTACSTAWSTCASPRSACPTRATRASASWSSAAASRRWTARAPRSARARPRSRSSIAAT